MNIILLEASQIDEQQGYIESQSQRSHIQQVLGLTVGDSLRIGCINGNIGSATIADILPNRILLSDIELAIAPPAKLDLTVVLALPRPKVLRRLVMDMTAIGVRDIVLVNSYRTDKSYWQSPMLHRLHEFVIEGLQQSVDTITPTLTLKKRLKPFVEDELAVLVANKSAIVAHPYAEMSFTEYSTEYGLPQILCIGAEGGWIDYEVNLLASVGCQSVQLGNRILRTESAVNVLCGRYLA